MAVAAITNSQDGTLSDTSEVTLVPAPLSGQNNVRTVIIANINSDYVTVRIQLANGAARRNIWVGTLSPGDTWSFGESGDVLVLDSPSKSMIAKLDGVPVTPLDFVASWLNSTES